MTGVIDTGIGIDVAVLRNAGIWLSITEGGWTYCSYDPV